MAENSNIEWTTHTFNAWEGCVKISAGCKHCYAETRAKRFSLPVWGNQGSGGTRKVTSESYWKQPMKWNRQAKEEQDWIAANFSGFEKKPSVSRPRVFSLSLGDLFEDWSGPMIDAQGNTLYSAYGDGWVANPLLKVGRDRSLLTMQDVRNRLFEQIDGTPNLDWLLLTKRPENIGRMTYDAWCKKVPGHVQQNEGDGRRWEFPSNVWLGTSVEDQKAADERIPHLLKVPAAVQFLSIEPLLGPIDFRGKLCDWTNPDGTGSWFSPVPGKVQRRLIDWVIIGGESGPGARPCNIEWIRDIVRQCREAGVKVFVKQLGSLPVQKRGIVLNDGESLEDIVPYVHNWKKRLTDPKGGDMAEWPEDLRVREVPTACAKPKGGAA